MTQVKVKYDSKSLKKGICWQIGWLQNHGIFIYDDPQHDPDHRNLQSLLRQMGNLLTGESSWTPKTTHRTAGGGGGDGSRLALMMMW